MTSKQEVIAALRDEFEYFVPGHSDPTLAAGRAFERIRSMIGLEGEKVTFATGSTEDPRVGLTFVGALRVGRGSDGTAALTMTSSIPKPVGSGN